jgi:hypothetical protein
MDKVLQDFIDHLVENSTPDDVVGILPRWISVEDRLPPAAEHHVDISETVLFYRPKKVGEPENTWIGAIYLSLGCGIAIHWMPLPERPK